MREPEPAASAATPETESAPARFEHGLKLVLYPGTALRAKCALLLQKECDQYGQLVPHFQEAAKEWRGYAVAAPQVGICYAFFVLRSDDEVQKQLGTDLKLCSEGWPTFVGNPVIVARSGKNHDTEACLSIPHPRPTPGVRHFLAKTRRPDRIDINYIDAAGASQSLTATGLLARVICHEIDHLDGVLFTDHLEGKDRARANDVLSLLTLRSR